MHIRVNQTNKDLEVEFSYARGLITVITTK
jgi:hypothetical protein